MFKVHLGDTPNSLTPADFEELGRRTQGFSGSDVNVVVKDVLMEPVRKTQEATHFKYALTCRLLAEASGFVLLDSRTIISP